MHQDKQLSRGNLFNRCALRRHARHSSKRAGPPLEQPRSIPAVRGAADTGNGRESSVNLISRDTNLAAGHRHTTGTRERERRVHMLHATNRDAHGKGAPEVQASARSRRKHARTASGVRGGKLPTSAWQPCSTKGKSGGSGTRQAMRDRLARRAHGKQCAIDLQGAHTASNARSACCVLTPTRVRAAGESDAP